VYEESIKRLKKIKEDFKNDPHLTKKNTVTYMQHQRRHFQQMMRVLADAGLLREGEWGGYNAKTFTKAQTTSD